MKKKKRPQRRGRKNKQRRSSCSKKAIGVKGRPGKSHLIRVQLNLAQLGEVHYASLALLWSVNACISICCVSERGRENREEKRAHNKAPFRGKK